MSSSLSTLNSLFEAGDSDPPPSIWNEWLWDCDLAEPVTVDCLLNRMHLLGLLIARLRAVREPHLMDVCVSLPQMVHQSTRVVQLTPRQLKDVVEDLQMHWMRYQDEHTDADALAELVDALMARFGSFCLRPYTYDDVNMRDAAAWAKAWALVLALAMARVWACCCSASGFSIDRLTPSTSLAPLLTAPSKILFKTSCDLSTPCTLTVTVWLA